MKTCSSCGHDVVGSGEMIVALPLTDESGEVFVGYPNFPMASIGCASCGHVSLYSMFALGLMKDGLPNIEA
jgi:hypothetical protein